MFDRLLLFIALNFSYVAALPSDPPPAGNAVIRAPAGQSEIVITTAARVAGAVHSLTWNGKEFKVVKWNCVFRIRDPHGVRPGEYSFRSFVIVGDRATVTESLKSLRDKFSGK